MYVLKLVLILFLVILFSACAGKQTINDFSQKAINSKDDTNSSIVNLSNSKDINISKVHAKVKHKISISDKKSVILKQKLSKCGVKYEPWADRLDKDLILMPKILKTCKSISSAASGYILHSTKKSSYVLDSTKGKNKKSRGYNVRNHLFIPYTWSSVDINTALNAYKK